jgi:hypothetical protein
MVGDRRHDIVGAHAVNMPGLAVLWDMVAGMSLKRLVRTNWWNGLLISLARFYQC